MPDDSPLPPPAVRGAALSVRTAAPGDIDRLSRIEERAFLTDRLSRRNLRALLRAPTADLLVGCLGGDVAGYALVLSRSTSSIARLYSLAVDPAHAGRGVGRGLLAAAERAALARGADALRLEVRTDNSDAMQLYERGGYQVIGRRDGYYQDGRAALRYERRLHSGASGRNAPGRLSTRAPVPAR